MKKYLLFYLFILLKVIPSDAQSKAAAGGPFLFNAQQLQQAKIALEAGSVENLAAYQLLLKKANRALTYNPVSVMQKTEVPPSGSKHDYMSIAPYHWPNPSSPNGLPYI
ncbi:MAG: hypothetical protein FGM61_07670, partial [Sediminibacterium sp.]|nr:hypothetical protein [Sediminibacterium sp.]